MLLSEGRNGPTKWEDILLGFTAPMRALQSPGFQGAPRLLKLDAQPSQPFWELSNQLAGDGRKI
jgi:hypothetical protein